MSALGWWARGAWHVARKELLSLFVTPLAYLVATLFLLNQGYNFALLLRVLNDPLAAPGPVMQFYFGGSFFLFWLPVIFICAALSMRLVAEERRLGTLEALLTAPLSPGQLVAGKFVGAYAFYAALWLPTAAFYVLLMGAGRGRRRGRCWRGTSGSGWSARAFGRRAAGQRDRPQPAGGGGNDVRGLHDRGDERLARRTGAVRGGEPGDPGDQPADDDAGAGAGDRRPTLAVPPPGGDGVAAAGGGGGSEPAPAVRTRAAGGAGRVHSGELGGAGEPARGARRLDGGHVYSLSERAREVLAGLPAAVEVTVIVPSTIGGGRPNPLQAELREVLARMTTAAPERLRVRFVDPDRDHQEASAAIGDYALTGRELADGVVLIRSGQGAGLRKAHLLPTDLVSFATGPDVQVTGPRVKEFRGEEALLGKFLAVTDARRVVVCATQGHGEPALDSLEPYSGYAHLRDLLTDAGLTVRTADLSGPEGLSGCDVLLVGGPQGRCRRST
ncbi:DUF7088 domain-containing protein [Nannocystis pusilla]|uniref:DUF7088 domain-containing protein n=1 Tax=Nannocystis pusilla TaxID=889268 RepID=UPI003B8159A5